MKATFKQMTALVDIKHKTNYFSLLVNDKMTKFH